MTDRDGGVPQATPLSAVRIAIVDDGGHLLWLQRLDGAAQRALINTRMLAPLPSGFSGQRLPVELEFEYIR